MIQSTKWILSRHTANIIGEDRASDAAKRVYKLLLTPPYPHPVKTAIVSRNCLINDWITKPFGSHVVV